MGIENPDKNQVAEQRLNNLRCRFSSDGIVAKLCDLIELRGVSRKTLEELLKDNFKDTVLKISNENKITLPKKAVQILKKEFGILSTSLMHLEYS
ncbi:MAG TPA: hypothetical protein EYG89_05100 [Bacteroidia bacterium]|nr:hypothetical protein [Bacteroidia bacterium]